MTCRYSTCVNSYTLDDTIIFQSGPLNPEATPSVGRIEDLLLVCDTDFVLLSVFDHVEKPSVDTAYCSVISHSGQTAARVCVPVSALLGPARLLHCCSFSGPYCCRYTRRDASASVARSNLKGIRHAPAINKWLWDQHCRL